MKIFSVIKTLFLYSLIIFVVFIIGEIFSRAFFPELSKNQVYYKIDDKNIISRGQNQHFNYLQSLKYRSKTKKEKKFDFNKKTIWLIGDSVTNGYGLKFTETYSFHLENIFKNMGYDYNIVTISEYNSNLKKSVDLINSNLNLFNENDIMIYQFNYNDILPKFSASKEIKKSKSFLSDVIKKTAMFRYAHLNKSSFARVLQHYAAAFSKKTSGTCQERGLDALSQYSYAYGLKGFEKDSLKAWNLFYESLSEINKISKDLNLRFIVLISPISLQLPYHNKQDKFNLDLSCSTLDPHAKIIEMLKNLNIEYSDPLPIFLEKINTDYNEQNYSQLFLDYDDNHPNAYGQVLLAYSLLNKF